MYKLNNIIMTDSIKEIEENNFFIDDCDCDIIILSKKNQIELFNICNNNPIYKITKYNLSNSDYLNSIINYKYIDKMIENQLSLNFSYKCSLFKDGKNILFLKDYITLGNILPVKNITTDIISNYILHKDSFVYTKELCINLQNCKMVVKLNNFICFDKFDWDRNIELFIFNDEDPSFKKMCIMLKEKNDIILFLKNYINSNNPNLSNFLDIINQHFTLLKDYQNDINLVDSFMKQLEYEIIIANKQLSLKIGNKKLEKIKNNIKKYFLPIKQNKDIKVYLNNFEMPDYDTKYKLIRCVDNNGIEIEDYDDIEIVKEAIAYIDFVNGYSIIDIYNGKVLNYKYKTIYNDINSIILESDYYNYRNKRKYFSKSNGIWIKANKNNIKEMLERYEILQTMN